MANNMVRDICIFFWNADSRSIDAMESDTGIWWIAIPENMLNPRVALTANHARIPSPSKRVCINIAIQETRTT